MMIKRLSILINFLLAVFALSAFGAEQIKFKPLSAVYQDNTNIPLKFPEGVACTKSAVFVADTGNGRLVRYALVNDELKDAIEVRIDQLRYPVRLKSTAKGDLLALDGKSRKIVKLSGAGAYVGYLDPQKVTAPDDFVPRSMAVDSKDGVYILDILGERVLVLDATDTCIRQIPFPKGYGYFADLTVDSKGTVFLIDSTNSQVLKAAPTDVAFSVVAKDLDTYLYLAVSINVDAQGRIYLLDQNDNGLVILGQDGKFIGRYLNAGWKPGQLYYPGQACLTESGLFAIADRNNNRVQLYKTQ